MTTIDLQIIEDLKNRAGRAFADALGAAKFPACSEQELATAWLDALRLDGNFYEDGWYDPPPHGVITLFGYQADGYARICQPSFRPREMWPGADPVWTAEAIGAAYASPVQRSTNLIGDFGLSFYQGENPAVWEHFERVLYASIRIAEHAEVDMPLHELYKYAMRLGSDQGFVNNIESSSDATGTNIGHTIPFSYKSDPSRLMISETSSFANIKEAIRTGRKFVNSLEDQIIEPNFALTVEPRFSTETMPNTWFHLTVVFQNGQRRISHGLRPVFARLGMDRLATLLPD